MFAIVFIIYRVKNILEDREEEEGPNRQAGEHHLASASRTES